MPEKQIIREVMANTLIRELPDEVVCESLLSRPITETISDIAIEKHPDAPFNRDQYQKALEFGSHLLKNWLENCPDEFDTDINFAIVQRETKRVIESIREWAEKLPPETDMCH